MRQLKINKSIINRDSSSLEKYLHEIGKEDEIKEEAKRVELVKKIQKGDKTALEQLMSKYLRFVISVAMQYQNQGLNMPDLVNEGKKGLVKAAENFDETRGFKFISYAVWYIRQSILQALAEQSRIEHSPLNDADFLNFIQEEQSLLTLTERERNIIKMFYGIGIQPMTLNEIGEKLELTRDRVRQIKEKAIRRLRYKMTNVNEVSGSKKMTLIIKDVDKIIFRLAGSGTITIDWGDETPNEINTLYICKHENDLRNKKQCEYCHTYRDLMVYTVTIIGNITHFDCEKQNIKSMDVSKNNELVWLDCQENQLTSLYLSKNSALKYLKCSKNQLTNLDVSKNIALTSLTCAENHLMILNVYNITKLTWLNCEKNQLTILDVSNNIALNRLECNENQLTSLDLSKNTKLEHLMCGDNRLTRLEVNNNPVLRLLRCQENQLTSLDVSKNTELIVLWCFNNQLTNLWVNKNRALRDFWCWSNQLTSLDVTKNIRLTELYCQKNLLTSLDLSKNTQLEKVDYSGNLFANLDADKDKQELAEQSRIEHPPLNEADFLNFIQDSHPHCSKKEDGKRQKK